MSYSEYFHVEEINNVDKVNKLLELGWEILETRVEEWVESEKEVPFKKSTFIFLMGQRI